MTQLTNFNSAHWVSACCHCQTFKEVGVSLLCVILIEYVHRITITCHAFNILRTCIEFSVTSHTTLWALFTCTDLVVIHWIEIWQLSYQTLFSLRLFERFIHCAMVFPFILQVITIFTLLIIIRWENVFCNKIYYIT